MDRKTYSAAGYVLASDLPFPELPQAPGEPEIVLETVAGSLAGPDETQYRVTPDPDGNDWCCFFVSPRGYRVAYAEGIEFFLLPQQRRVLCAELAAGLPPEMLRHMFLHHIVPFLASLDGRIFLHAAGIDLGSYAVAFAGDSGAGKSTLALAFSRHGHKFYSDDALPLELRGPRVFARPGFPYVRANDDSMISLGFHSDDGQDTLDWRDKRRIQADRSRPAADRELPLACVYFLGDETPSGVDILPLHPADAFFKLTQSMALLELKAKPVLRARFDTLVALAERLPMFEIRYPRSYQQLPHVIAAVQRHSSEIYVCP